MKKRKTTTIDCFFKKPKPSNNERDDASASPDNVSSLISKPADCCGSTAFTTSPVLPGPADACERSTSTDGASVSKPLDFNGDCFGTANVVTKDSIAKNSPIFCGPASFEGKVDIGFYVGQSASDNEKVNILKNAWLPGKDFNYPFSVHRKSNKDVKCFLSAKHFDNFKWATYSQKLGGLFCKYCVLFANKVGGVNRSTPLKKLVTEPLQKYSKLLGKDGDLVMHEKTGYHKHSIAAAADFLKSIEKGSVLMKIDSGRELQVKENRERLVPVIESILFLGRQNLALRGHRDYGTIECSESCVPGSSNEGNFRELLKFRVKSGDEKLKQFLENPKLGASYVSNRAQNELIECCGEEILNSLLKKVKENKFFSIIFDETTDISKENQMSIVFRYFDENTNEVREDFATFIDVYKSNIDNISDEPLVSGKVLAKTVLNFIENCGLEYNNCIGIGTDTCSVMLSDEKGAVSEMQKHMNNAIKCPCYSHAFNLSLSKASNVQDIRNASGVMKEVVNFFNVSPKRSFVLKEILVNANCENHHLKKLCETRWTERQESVSQFQKCFPLIVEALEVVTRWSGDSSAQSQRLLNSLLATNFIVALGCLNNMYKYTEKISVLLQKKNLAANKAKEVIVNITSVLKGKRENAEETFAEIFKEIETLHTILGIEISLPRMSIHQRNRCNVPYQSPEEYYRIRTFIPVIDAVLLDLTNRFPSIVFNTLSINQVIPSEIVKMSTEQFNEVAVELNQFLAPILDEDKKDLIQHLKVEMELWKEKWKRSDSLPDNPISVLQNCDGDIFPFLRTVFRILCTLPVSVASSERSFSALKRLKMWLRSTMKQDRLVGLALLHIHRDIELSVQSIIDRFAKRKTRKLDFVL